jgi:hypothetical protein
MSDTLKFGTSVVDITPGYPVWLSGYANRTHRSTGVSEPISLRCLAIASEQKTALLFALDLIGLRVQTCEAIYARLERQVGIGFPDVMLACSHTHFAPVPYPVHRGSAVALGGNAFTQHVAAGNGPAPDEIEADDLGLVAPDPRFVTELMDAFVRAARESMAVMRPGVLEEARVQAPQVVFNRRTIRSDGTVETNYLYPESPEQYQFSPTDTELTILRVRGRNGMLAVLANFGCHPVTGGHPQERAHYQISADYPFYLRQVVEDACHCPAFFTLGAAGDAVPIDRMGDCRKRIGAILGNSILLAERQYVEVGAPRLATGTETVAARTIMTTQAATAADDCEQAKVAFLARLREGPSDDPELHAAAERFDDALRAADRAQMYPENTHDIQLQFMQIGDVSLVAFPFEPFSEIALKLKAARPRSILVSCAAGYQGYLPLAAEQDSGGYEVSERSNHFAADTGDRLLAAAIGYLDAAEHSEKR